nr:hypothetical protein OH820_33380 [Streptomyces sp. NBC_00857]
MGGDGAAGEVDPLADDALSLFAVEEERDDGAAESAPGGRVAVELTEVGAEKVELGDDGVVGVVQPDVFVPLVGKSRTCEVVVAHHLGRTVEDLTGGHYFVAGVVEGGEGTSKSCVLSDSKCSRTRASRASRREVCGVVICTGLHPGGATAVPPATDSGAVCERTAPHSGEHTARDAPEPVEASMVESVHRLCHLDGCECTLKLDTSGY